jgi:glycosyltransferase involved in cell wall biosynthesis
MGTLTNPSVAETSHRLARPVRICYLVTSLDVGGTETQMVQVASRLHSDEFAVTVACLHARGPLLDTLQEHGIPVVEFPTQQSLISFRGMRQFLRLGHFLRLNHFDVFHSHDLWANLLGVPAARIAGVPLVISSQRDLGHLPWYTEVRKKVIGRIHRSASLTLVNSRAVRNFVVDGLGVPAGKIRVLHNAVECRPAAVSRPLLFPNLPANSKLIAVISNMHPGKGHEYIVDAAPAVCSQFPEARFVMVGDGKQRRPLEQRVKQIGLEGNFVFLGYRNDAAQILATCDVSLLASEAEGLPNAILESMVSGVPIVATNVGGIGEVITNGETGLLIPSRDPEAIAIAVARVLADPTLAATLRNAAQREAKTRFSFDRVIGGLQDLYSSSVRAALVAGH